MDNNKVLIPALLAVGGSLAALPASALELGDISVQSTLGQPLRASIAYALAPHEQLSDYCVTLANGPAKNGLPAVQNATLRVSSGVISLTGRAVVREPLMSVRVNISCPYTPRLSREYMLFIDPALPVQNEPASTPAAVTRTQATRSSNARSDVPVAERTVTRRPAVVRTPIDAVSRYRVQPGDTLSAIAERIKDRPVGLWSAVTKIFDANPHAFISDDPNKLKAGAWLDIPDFGGAVNVVANEPVAPPQPVVTETVADVASGATADHTTYPKPAAAPANVDLQPGDLVLDSEKPFVETAEPVKDLAAPSVGIVDTAIEVSTTAESPNVTSASISAATTARPAPEAKTNWLIWMIGGGVALLAGLLLFGRRNRYENSDPYAEAAAAHPMRRSSDSVTVETLSEPEFDLDDDSPTAENLALDADLSMGTGLKDGTDVDVRQDFGFAATTDLDFELGEEDSETTQTDMMSIPTVEELTVLEREVLPGADEYDMSVIVDATKMPHPDDATMHDLKAVAVEDEIDTDDKEYTLDQEIDYQILEQDYEDELTATQALNLEIEKAAAELVGRIKHSESGSAGSDDETAEMRLATVTEIDATSRLSAEGGDSDDLEDTGVNAEITQELGAEDKTVEMSKSDNDDTAEMTVESGKVDTKAG